MSPGSVPSHPTALFSPLTEDFHPWQISSGLEGGGQKKGTNSSFLKSFHEAITFLVRGTDGIPFFSDLHHVETDKNYNHFSKELCL